MELILDASSASPRVGLASRGTLVWDSSHLVPKQHTRQLLPEILRGLDETLTGFGDIALVVVALGPGPFNGLRVAAATAKGIVTGTGAALVGIRTMLAEVNRCPPSVGTVRPILRAGRTGFITALFTWREGSWHQVEDEHYIADVAYVQSSGEAIHCCDDTEDPGTSVPGNHRPILRATGIVLSRLQLLACMGWCRYSAGDTSSAAALQPVYARPPHITTPRNRRQ